MFALSWGKFFSDNNSETGSGQLLELSGNGFRPTWIWVKIKVFDDKLEFRDYFVHFFRRLSPVRF